MTAEVDVEVVTEERAEAWLLSGHDAPRDRMEVAQAVEYMQGLDAMFEAGMLGVPVTVTLVDQSVSTLEEVEP